MTMNVQEQLRHAIERQQHRLLARVPPDREAALLALVRAQDRLPVEAGTEPSPDLITGRRLANPGGNKAIQLCFAATEAEPSAASGPSGASWDQGAEAFLAACAQLAGAEVVLAHCETGFMRVVEDGAGTFDAWIATKRVPMAWRERADIDWWAAWLARRHEAGLLALRAELTDPATSGPTADDRYRRLAAVHVRMMAYQLGYPADAVVGGCTIELYRAVLVELLASALRARDRGEPTTVQSEQALIEVVATALGADPFLIDQAMSAFTLDQESAADHATVPGVAAAPLTRIATDRIVLSLYGLLTEPLLFLARELRRRDAEGYHNSAFLREDVFRQDLYALFEDKRFITSSGRIVLRQRDGNARTDIDAAIFDRKTGTLGLFELKSQDPFARSVAELHRQRDNVLYANRQISGVLTWLKGHGGDELLGRVDAATAKRFRVQKVLPFVLGRYLVHFNDGPEPDRRAAWATWPQVLRLLNGQPVRAAESNPLASLFNRLTKGEPLSPVPADEPPRRLDLGDAHLMVYPSYAALQGSSVQGCDAR